MTYTDGIVDSDKLNSKSDLKFVGEWRIEESFMRDAVFLFNNLGYAYMTLDDNLGPLRLMGGKMFIFEGLKCRMEFEVNDSVNPHHLDITRLDSGKEFSMLFLANFIDDDTLKLAHGKSPVERATEFTKENTEICKRKKFTN